MEARKEIPSSWSHKCLMSGISQKPVLQFMYATCSICLWDKWIKDDDFLAFFFFPRRCFTTCCWFESLIKVYFARKYLNLEQRRFFYVYSLANLDHFTENLRNDGVTSMNKATGNEVKTQLPWYFKSSWVVDFSTIVDSHSFHSLLFISFLEFFAYIKNSRIKYKSASGFLV